MQGPADDSDLEFGRINSMSSGDKQPEKLIKKVFVRRKKKLTVGPRHASVQTEVTSSTQSAHLSQSSPPLPPRASSSHRLPSPDAAHSTPFYLLFPSLPPGVPQTYPYSPYIPPYYPPPPPQPATAGPSTPVTAEQTEQQAEQAGQQAEQAGQQAEQIGQAEQSAHATDGRMSIEPDGDTFYPSKQPAHKIRDIIQSRYDAPYISWNKVPKEVRDMWFKEFEKDFDWLPQHNDRIRKNFEKRGSARMRDIFTDIRKSDERPLWIGESIWAELNAVWGSPEYLRIRDQNRKNRASNVRGMGSSLHAGGSQARLYEGQSITSSIFASNSQDSAYVQQIAALTAKLEHMEKTQADWQSQMQMQQQQIQMQQAQLLDELRKMREQFNKKNADSGAEETELE